MRRIQGAPALAPRDMTSNAIAHAQGASAGQLLRAAGVNVDLAPVADVESPPASFLGSRAFGSSAAVVAARACAFAGGLASAGVAYTLKHFPGLGRALTSTDTGPVTVAASPAALRADYLAYRRCGAAPTALVMVSSAIDPNLAGTLPAVMSPTIYHRELPLALGLAGSRTISDDLGTRALAGQPTAALQAIKAGLELALYANSESASADAYAMLLAAARPQLILARETGLFSGAKRRRNRGKSIATVSLLASTSAANLSEWRSGRRCSRRRRRRCLA